MSGTLLPVPVYSSRKQSQPRRFPPVSEESPDPTEAAGDTLPCSHVLKGTPAPPLSGSLSGVTHMKGFVWLTPVLLDSV